VSGHGHGQPLTGLSPFSPLGVLSRRRQHAPAAGRTPFHDGSSHPTEATRGGRRRRRPRGRGRGRPRSLRPRPRPLGLGGWRGTDDSGSSCCRRNRRCLNPCRGPWSHSPARHTGHGDFLHPALPANSASRVMGRLLVRTRCARRLGSRRVAPTCRRFRRCSTWSSSGGNADSYGDTDTTGPLVVVEIALGPLPGESDRAPYIEDVARVVEVFGAEMAESYGPPTAGARSRIRHGGRCPPCWTLVQRNHPSAASRVPVLPWSGFSHAQIPPSFRLGTRRLTLVQPPSGACVPEWAGRMLRDGQVYVIC
jgi:hypothetical protein